MRKQIGAILRNVVFLLSLIFFIISCGGGGGDGSSADKTFTLQYSAGAGGSVAGKLKQSVSEGGNGTTVNAVPDDGFVFNRWSDGYAESARTDENVKANIKVQAQFKAEDDDGIQYTLSYTAGSGGSISGITPQLVDEGDNGSSITAVPNTGYHFVEWSDGSSTNPRIDSAVTENITVSASFAINSYTLSYSAGSNGSLTGGASQNVNHGSNGTAVTAVPNINHHFVQWSDGSMENPRIDNSVTGNISVTANFAINSYTLSYSAGSNGSLTGSASQNVNQGSNGVEVAAVPNTGYLFDEWSDGNISNPRIDTNVTQNIAVTANFILKTYTLTYSAGEGGGLTGETEQVVNHGSNGTVVTAVPDTDYYFIQWSDGNITNPRTDINVTGDVLVSAIFSTQPPLSPWLVRLHSGALTINVKGPTKAEITWEATDGEIYDLYITRDAETDLSNYSAYGADLITDVTPPILLDDLVVDESVYVALMVNNELSSWSSFAGKTLGVDNNTANGYVRSQAISEDGTRYVGGNFTHVNLVNGGGVAIPVGAENPLTVFPSVNGVVEAVAPDGVGGWYLGGGFISVGGKERWNLAHIDNLGRVTDWNPGADSEVRTLVVADGVIYAGGTFNAVGGGTGTTTRRRLAAFDTAGNVTDWNPGADSWVRTLVVADGVIYTGGTFNVVGGGTGTTTRRRLAAFDTAGNVTDWNPGVDLGSVSTLAIADGVIYAGGLFGSAGGGTGTTTRHSLAAFDTAGNLTDWNPGADSGVRTLVVADGVIYAGGDFTGVGGGTGTTTRHHLAAFDAAGNVTDWNPGVADKLGAIGSIVSTLAIADGVVYVGGSFAKAGGGTGTTPRNRLAAFDMAGNLADWNPRANETVNTLAIANDIIYAGGWFNGISAGTTMLRSRLAAFDIAGNLTDWNPGVSGLPETLAIADGVIYAGGTFTSAGGGTATTPRSRLAAFDTAGNVMDWNPGVNNRVGSLAIADGVIYAGGSFSGAGGGTGTTPRSRLAAFDTAGNVMDWNPGVNNRVDSLAIANGVIYVGGTFTSAVGGTGTTPRSRLAAFDTAGNLMDWNPGVSSTVGTLAVADGIIYAGGDFSGAGGGTGTTPRSHLAAFDAAGNVMDWNPGVNNRVDSLAIANGVIYVGGTFSRAGGGTGTTLRDCLAAFDMAGNITDWNPGVADAIVLAVSTLVVDKGVIYAGGSFNVVGTLTIRSRLAAFDEDGNLLNQ